MKDYTKEQQKKVQNAVRQLPEKLQIVALLYYMEDYYKTGKLYVTGSNNGDNDDILLHTIVCNKDGTVTCAVYRMKYTFSFEIDS